MWKNSHLHALDPNATPILLLQDVSSVVFAPYKAVQISKKYSVLHTGTEQYHYT